jgi:hypothetical protein
MANESASQYFYALLSDNAPVEFQRRTLKYAEDTKNVSLMVKLAQLHSLDPEIDAALGKRGEAEVLMYWASRPGRTTEQLVERFAKEKRATLLSELAARTDLTDALYHELSKNTSASVSVALLKNTAAPVEVRKKAAERAITTVREGYSASSNVASMFRNLPQEVRDHAVMFASTPAQICGLIELLSDKAVRSAATYLASLMRTKDLGWNARSALELIWDRLEIDDRKLLQEEMADVAKSAESSSSQQHAREFANKSLVDPVTEAIRQIGVETDPDMIRKLYLVPSNASYQRRRDAFVAALRNPNTPFDVLSGDLRWAEDEDMATLSRRADFNQEAALVLLSQNGSAAMFETFAEVLDGEQLLRKLCQPGVRVYWAEYTKPVRTNPKFALELFSVDEVLHSDFCLEEARRVILERLGDDDKRWQTFQGLAPEWSSTLGSLLDAVDQLV